MPPQTMRQFLKPPEKAPDTLPRTQSTMSLLDYFSTVIQGLADPTGWTEPKAEDFDNPHAYTQALKAHGVGQLLGMAAPLAAPLGVLTRGARTAEVATEAPQTLKAFHGSPHDFGEVGQRGAFKMSAIGSGEGGQAYSYGHYFAQNPKVSEEYRRQVSAQMKHQEPPEIQQIRGLVKGGTKVDEARDHVLNGLADQLDEAKWQLQGAKAAAPRQTRNTINPVTAGKQEQDLVDHLQRRITEVKAWPSDSFTREPGHMYELNLHTSPESLLDWDKPLSQQPKKVIDWLRQSDAPFGYKAKSKNWRGSGALPDDVWLKSLENTTGEELYRALVTPIGRAGHTEGLASQQLADAGIHGVQYLDQGSRGIGSTRLGTSKNLVKQLGSDEAALAEAKRRLAAGDNPGLWKAVVDDLSTPETRNYVIFPHFEHLIEISKKYGISLPAAASLYKWQQSQKGVE